MKSRKEGTRQAISFIEGDTEPNFPAFQGRACPLRHPASCDDGDISEGQESSQEDGREQEDEGEFAPE